MDSGNRAIAKFRDIVDICYQRWRVWNTLYVPPRPNSAVVTLKRTMGNIQSEGKKKPRKSKDADSILQDVATPKPHKTQTPVTISPASKFQDDAAKTSYEKSFTPSKRPAPKPPTALSQATSSESSIKRPKPDEIPSAVTKSESPPASPQVETKINDEPTTTDTEIPPLGVLPVPTLGPPLLVTDSWRRVNLEPGAPDIPTPPSRTSSTDSFTDPATAMIPDKRLPIGDSLSPNFRKQTYSSDTIRKTCSDENEDFINWLLSGIEKNLSCNMSESDLRCFGVAVCAHLISSGVLTANTDGKISNDGLTFKLDKMYFWTQDNIKEKPPDDIYSQEQVQKLEEEISRLKEKVESLEESAKCQKQRDLSNEQMSTTNFQTESESEPKRVEKSTSVDDLRSQVRVDLKDAGVQTEEITHSDLRRESQNMSPTSLNRRPSQPPPPPPPLPGMGGPPLPPPLPPGDGASPPPPPPFPGMGGPPVPPPLPEMEGPPVPPPLPGMGGPPPPPPPLPGMGSPPPPPPPLPGMGGPPPPPPPLPGMGGPPPPPPPLPGMGGPPPPPFPGMGGPSPPPFPGMGGPPPPPPPGMGGPPPPPPSFSGPAPLPAPPVGGWNNPDQKVIRKEPKNPEVPMKPLYWTRLLVPTSGAVAAPVSTPDAPPLWAQIDEEKDLNIKEFENLFSRQVTQRKAATKKEVEQKPSKIQPAKILDSKRSKTVGILEKSLHIDFSEIENAVYNMDTSIINLETLQQIYEIRPTLKEIDEITSFEKENPDVPLDSPEVFLLKLSSIRNFSERIACLVFQNDFNDSISTVGSKLANLRSTCEFMRSSEELKKVMSLILTFGNYMNGGNRSRGQADGFGLEILGKLKDVKSNTPGVTLLHYIVKAKLAQEGEDHPDHLPLPVPEHEDVQAAATISFEDISKELDKLERGLNTCRSKYDIVIKENPDDSGPFKQIMDLFLSESQKELTTQKDSLTEAKNKFIAMMQYYQFKPKGSTIEKADPNEFFVHWISFCRDFKDIWKKEQIRIRDERVAKLYQKQTMMVTKKRENGLKARMQKHFARKG